VEVVVVPCDRADELGARLFCMPNTVRGLRTGEKGVHDEARL
jgi:hypothetical protein